MTTPRVSLIVTCCDLGRYLPETIASIQRQTFGDYDLCIVDDGSTDEDTLRLLGELAHRMPVVSTPNRGLSAARNEGLRHTSGAYVCAVDADDLLEPTLLEKSVARLDGDPSLTFVSHWLEAFGDESWLWRPQRCDFPLLLAMNTVNGAALVRREALESIGGWDETMRDGCEDWDLWISLVERGHRGDIIPEVLFRYRRRADSMSRVKFAGDRLADVFRAVLEKHSSAYASHAVWLATRREVDIAASRLGADRAAERLTLTALPALAREHDNLEAAQRLQTRLRLEHEAAAFREIEPKYAAAVHEVGTLRQSWSWRLTLPLRVVGAWALGLRRLFK